MSLFVFHYTAFAEIRKVEVTAQILLRPGWFFFTGIIEFTIILRTLIFALYFFTENASLHSTIFFFHHYLLIVQLQKTVHTCNIIWMHCSEQIMKALYELFTLHNLT